MMRVLSFDCAVKHMGICCLDIDTKWVEKMNIATRELNTTLDAEKYLDTITEIINSAVKNVMFRNLDLMPGVPAKKITGIDFARAMNTHIAEISKTITPDVVLIECQPALNGKSTSVCDILAYHYLCAGVHVEIVSARLKNKISICDNLGISKYRDRNYSTSYTGNKAHTRENFKYWAKLWNIDLKKVDKPLNDVADAFMQILGWSTTQTRETIDLII